MYEEHGVPDFSNVNADYPGVDMENERDVLMDRQTAESGGQTMFTAAEVEAIIEDRNLRAAALQAAMATNPLTATDLINAAKQVEEYLRNGATGAHEG